MAKFKKGDRVRNLEANPFIKKGATGTVDQNDSLVPWVIWDSLEMMTERGQRKGRRWYRRESFLELIEEEQPDKTMAKFNKGDRVRNLRESGFVKKDATGTVDENSIEPFVIWDSDDMLNEEKEDRRWAQHEHHLELITEKPDRVPDAGKLVEPLTIDRMRFEAACAAMQGICAHPDTWGYPAIESVAGGAVKMADALITELSKPTNP